MKFRTEGLREALSEVMKHTKLSNGSSCHRGGRHKGVVCLSSSFSTELLFALALIFGFSALVGCRQDMHDQPKYKALAESGFFSDSRASRQLVPGTIARGQLREDLHLYQGKVGGKFADSFPFPVTKQILERGQDRYNIFCTPCHDHLGNGQGMVVQRGLRAPPPYHIDRLRQAPVGYFYDVITNGFGAMQDYSSQIPVADRWAIVAYIRVLQLSQHARASELSDEDRSRLNEKDPHLTAEPHHP